MILKRFSAVCSFLDRQGEESGDRPRQGSFMLVTISNPLLTVFRERVYRASP